MKKAISILICLMLVLSLAAPVFAAGDDHTHTITITNDNKEQHTYVYKAYRIFTGVLDETGVLSDIEWDAGVNGTALLAALQAEWPTEFGSANDAEDVAGVLAKNSTHDNAFAVAFADIVASYTLIDPSAADEEANRDYTYLNETAGKVSTYNAGKDVYEITVPGDGYYLVINTSIPKNADGTATENTTYSRHILQVVRDVTVAHKGTFPHVDKVINEDGQKVNVNEKSIGDVVDYDLIGTIPTNIAFYDTYFYRFNDTLSKGLTYNGDAKVYIVNGTDSVDVTKYFYIHATEYHAVNGTQITIAIQDLLQLRNLTPAVTIDADTKVIVDYTATLNENAVIGVEGNPNLVDLDYSNNPNQDGDPSDNPPPPNPDKPVPQWPIGDTPDKVVKTYTTSLKITKHNGQGNILTGAEFTLTGNGVNVVVVEGDYFEVDPEGTYYLLKDKTYTDTAPVFVDDPTTEDIDERTADAYADTETKYKLVHKITVDSEDNTITNVKAFVDENGIVTFTGLGVGEYTLTETVTPKGFNTIEPIHFKIYFDATTHTFYTDNNVINVENATNTLYTTIVNEAGSKLPSTGGMGTTLFYVFGSVMFVGAAVLLITKKRMAA